MTAPDRPVHVVFGATGAVGTAVVAELVRRGARPPLLLTGDLTYGAELLQRGQLPGVGKRHQLAESTRKVLALQEQLPGLVVLPAHDPAAARRLLDS